MMPTDFITLEFEAALPKEDENNNGQHLSMTLTKH